MMFNKMFFLLFLSLLSSCGGEKTIDFRNENNGKKIELKGIKVNYFEPFILQLSISGKQQADTIVFEHEVENESTFENNFKINWINNDSCIIIVEGKNKRIFNVLFSDDGNVIL